MDKPKKEILKIQPESANLIKVGNSISITNKLLFESGQEWWNHLPQIWKKIFNAHIGKISNYPKFNSIDISCNGSNEPPSSNDLEKIFQIKKMEYHFFDNHDSGIENIESIYPIDKLKNLNELRFSTCQGINWNEEVKKISPLSHLRILEVSNTYSLQNLDKLKNLDRLEKLYIKNNNIFNLSGISKLKNLKNLDISGNPIIDYSPLKTLTNLISLEIGTQYPNPFQERNSNNGLENLKYLINLKFLNLAGKYFKELISLNNLNKLEYLDLSENRITDTSHLNKLINLKHLDLSDNYLNNISGIGKLLKLEHLNLRNNKYLKDIRELSNMLNLEFLSIEGTSIDDLYPLANLQKLKVLEVSVEQEEVVNTFKELIKRDDLIIKYQEKLPF